MAALLLPIIFNILFYHNFRHTEKSQEYKDFQILHPDTSLCQMLPMFTFFSKLNLFIFLNFLSLNHLLTADVPKYFKMHLLKTRNSLT